MSQKQSFTGTLRVPNRGRWFLEDQDKRTIELHTLINEVMGAADGKLARYTSEGDIIAFRFHDSKEVNVSHKYDNQSGWLLEAKKPESYRDYNRTNLREVLLNAIGCMNRKKVTATFDGNGFSISEYRPPT